MSEYIFTLPDLGEGTVEAEVSEWHIKPGDVVKEDQAIVDMLTDKAAVELPAPVSGTVVSLGGEPGDIIMVGAPLVTFETDALKPATASQAPATLAPAAATPAPAPQKPAPVAVTPVPAPQKPAPTVAASAAATEAAPPPMPVMRPPARHNVDDSGAPAATLTTGRVLTSPAIRRLAREHHVDLGQIKGSGARGRIMRSDFDAYVNRSHQHPAPVPPHRRTGAREIKVIGMRRMIAQRMSASKSEIPHFTYVEEIDVTELEAFRQQLNRHYAAHHLRFSYLPLLVQAITKALVGFPQCNALYDKERNVVVQHNPVHVGIATQTKDGLKVPVIHHAEEMSLPTLTLEITRTTQMARDGSAPKAKLSGSTITVTSLGKLGGIVSTPVINQPEVAIIGVNRAVDRPMVIDGGIYIRRMMNLSASFDHRFVDGYDAAEFIQAIRELLENPTVTFAAG